MPVPAIQPLPSMPAWTLMAAGVQLPCSALRWLVVERGPIHLNTTSPALRLRKGSADQRRRQWRLRLFNSIARAQTCTSVTSQRCTAVSIDTRTAVARFFWLVLEAHLLAGWCTPGFRETPIQTRQNPYPWGRVRFFAGTGAGSPGIPQGYP